MGCWKNAACLRLVPTSQGLLAISRRCFEGIINFAAVPFGRIDKPVPVLFLIYWLEEEPFVTRAVFIFDQHSGRAIESPHVEACSKESSIGVELIQIRHRMKTIDGGSILSINTVVSAIFDRTFLE
jgi:hypothetical protein